MKLHLTMRKHHNGAWYCGATWHDSCMGNNHNANMVIVRCNIAFKQCTNMVRDVAVQYGMVLAWVITLSSVGAMRVRGVKGGGG